MGRATSDRPSACPDRRWVQGTVHAYQRDRPEAAGSQAEPAVTCSLAKLDRFDLIILDDLSYARKDRPKVSYSN
ncbi:protein of unknown function (plasmid) [Cupriavidus taiwanensis]|nr:protein of unknown function [Cupriavidus taiwanensis]